jgi:acetyl/propionyl-CoA carboxylase alpha subunit
MLSVSVNQSRSFQLTEGSQGEWLLDGLPFEGDVQQISPMHYHVLWKHRSFNVEILEQAPSEKRWVLRINGQLFTTTAKDRFDLLLDSLGMNQASKAKQNQVKAPMPGLIQSVEVSEGATVQKGDLLLVLVAMKMENALKSPGEGIVKAIRCQAGESVDKNQVLIEFA